MTETSLLVVPEEGFINIIGKLTRKGHLVCPCGKQWQNVTPETRGYICRKCSIKSIEKLGKLIHILNPNYHEPDFLYNKNQPLEKEEDAPQEERKDTGHPDRVQGK